MTRFLIRRLLHGLLVLWLITVAVFALFFVAPSNVARTLGGTTGDAADDRADQPPARARPADLEAVPDFVGHAFQGNLGYDYYHQVPVTTIIAAGHPDHGVAGARRRRDLDGAGRLQRRGLGGAPAVVRGPQPDGVRAVLLLDAVVPARAAAALPPVLQAHPGRPRLVPGRRLPAAVVGDRAVGPPPDPALARAGPAAGGDVHPADPRLDAGRARGGLHPHRAVEGHHASGGSSSGTPCAAR